MELDKLQKIIENESQEILKMIEQTPYASRNKIEEYHSKIIEKLDSEEAIIIPSPIHRNLHQLMWMKGHEIYGNMIGEKAFMDFADPNSEHRMRFDVWYARKYILGKRLNPWELKMVEEASRECIRKYKHPLAEIIESEVLE